MTEKPCQCGRNFTCSWCSRRVGCDGKVNIHRLKICRNCCAKQGIKAILNPVPIDTRGAPAELELSTTPRVGMMERADTEETLKDAWAGGRISDSIYDTRMAAAGNAITQRDLDLLTADLPKPPPAPPVKPLTLMTAAQQLITWIPPLGWIVLLLLIAALTSGH